ncbi:MAG: hypothetical protein QXP04_03720 [Candidatus Nanoarchaeia archaeon]|nr:hypothetical protein [Candidatus Jingweiarchaeum tengchongense]
MTKYPLHFIGNSTYSLELFIKEAKKYGISRALPFYLIRKFRSQDIILLAVKDGEEAKVFGYMIVEGFSVPSELLEKILNETGAKFRIEVKNEQISRGCGSYVLTKVAYIEEGFEKVVEKLSEEYKVNKFKSFINGRLKLIKPFNLKIKFFRGIKYVDIPEEYSSEFVTPKISGISRYVHRGYTSEKEKKNLESRLESESLMRWCS